MRKLEPKILSQSVNLLLKNIDNISKEDSHYKCKEAIVDLLKALNTVKDKIVPEDKIKIQKAVQANAEAINERDANCVTMWALSEAKQEPVKRAFSPVMFSQNQPEMDANRNSELSVNKRLREFNGS